MTGEPLRPLLRRVEIFPYGKPDQMLFAFRDPEGFAPPIVAPYAAALLATLMNGQRTLAEIQSEFLSQTGVPIALADLEKLLAQFEEALLLDSPRYRKYWEAEIKTYLDSPIRRAAHAGGAYAGEPDALEKQLNDIFFMEKGPGAPQPNGNGAAARNLRGVLSPHIDLHRGGPIFAWAYKRILEESEADLFVVFGTAHSPMNNLFCVSRKHFDTPLGLLSTDNDFIDLIAQHFDAHKPADSDATLFGDELAHRQEHSIEFQALFLQYLFGKSRPFKIVPILTGSFHEYIETGASPSESPEVAAMIAAVQAAEKEYPGKVCYISGGDLAHVGRRFGDPWILEPDRLEAQREKDHRLLDGASQADALAFFRHVAMERDASRICGLAPTYTMLEAMRPARGELLAYDQAVEPDGSACVSFASMAFYGE